MRWPQATRGPLLACLVAVLAVHHVIAIEEVPSYAQEVERLDLGTDLVDLGQDGEAQDTPQVAADTVAADVEEPNVKTVGCVYKRNANIPGECGKLTALKDKTTWESLGCDKMYSYDDTTGVHPTKQAGWKTDCGNSTEQASPIRPELGDSNPTNGTEDANATNISAVFSPDPLKMPLHRHMKANKDGWAKLGGWTQSKQTALHKAHLAFQASKQQVIDASSEKEIVDMGCPCPGEKYYNLVFENMGSLESNLSSSVNASAQAMLNATEHTAHMKKMNASKADSNLVKRMRKKYGKLGPNSSWQAHHEAEKRRAKVALKAATAKEETLFKMAKPEFDKMKEDDPAFFTNGDCSCPAAWGKQDAAMLAAKEADDLEKDYWREMKKHRHNLNEMSGENERLQKVESAGDPELAPVDTPQV